MVQASSLWSLLNILLLTTATTTVLLHVSYFLYQTVVPCAHTVNATLIPHGCPSLLIDLFCE